MSAARCAPVVVAAAALAMLAPGARAAGTRTWTEEPAGLAEGLADGMAVSRAGRLYRAPLLTRVDGVDAAAAQIWSLAADAAGGLYLGTGPDGRVLRLAPLGRMAGHAAVVPPLVTALAVAPDGTLLAGTAPDGLVYRIDASGAAEIWSETGERYIWTLVVTAGGEVFAGTGERGRVLRILPSGATEVFFDSDEAHVKSLLLLRGGDLIAGGATRGLVYRIDSDGRAFVLHDDDLPEVVALAVEPDGGVVAATLASLEEEAKRPALHLRLPEGVPIVGPTDETVALVEETTVRGYIEGLRPAGDGEPRGVRGRVVRIAPDGSVKELWSSPRDAPFCLLADRLGRVLFGTGEPARLYRVEAVGDVALLATLREAQATSLVSVKEVLYLGTSNPAALYRVHDGAAETGTFVSRAYDAGAPARWGSIRWQVDESADGTELFTRTGNSQDPDATWSGWSPALTAAAGSAIVNPDGRYLQWRVRQRGGGASVPRLSNVTVVYEPYNRPPEVRDVRLELPAAGTLAPLRVRWSSWDPDGDAAETTIRYRPAAGGPWLDAGVARPEDGDDRADGWRSVEWGWDTTQVPEGAYEVGVFATDQPGNPAGEGLVSLDPPVVRTIVDRTPPSLEITVEPGGPWAILAEDAHSEVRRLELVREGRTRFTARPIDGVHDSRVEHYRVNPPTPPDGWSIRGVDAAGNVAEQVVPLE
jgi:hypothetical protein